MDALENLLLASHFQTDKIQVTGKETSLDVTKIRLKLNPIIKKTIIVAEKIHTASDTISTMIMISSMY